MKKSMEVLDLAFPVPLQARVPTPVPPATARLRQVLQTRENSFILCMTLKRQMRPCCLPSEVKSCELFILQTMNGVTLRTDIIVKDMCQLRI